jgi:glycosyltransferase involved in cell wall biosynthesis
MRSAPARGLRLLVYSTQMETAGGIESHVVELCLRLAPHSERIVLVSSRYALGGDDERRLRQAGVELLVNRQPWSSASPARKRLWTLWTLIRLLRYRFDVVYTNGQGRNPALLLAWYRGRARCVHHHHTACDVSDVETWPVEYRGAMRRADAIVVCAEYIRPRMQRELSRDDVSVVYCFSRQVEVDPITPGATPCVTFGYYGRLIPEKGIDIIFRLSDDSRLADIRWCIWGSYGAYQEEDFRLHPGVRYGGSFSDQAGLRNVLQQLDCFCLFSTHPEGLPISLMEVMGAGRPWIATAQGGIPELVHDPASCMLVDDVEDYESLVSACLAMRERILTGVTDSARQRAFYQKRFGAPELLHQWCHLLRPNDALSASTVEQHQ